MTSRQEFNRLSLQMTRLSIVKPILSFCAYSLLTSGDHSLVLVDIEVLMAKEVQSIPLSYCELERNFGMFGNLLGTVLGQQHTRTTAYQSFWNLLTQSV